MSTPELSYALTREVTDQIGTVALDQSLEGRLNRELGADSELYTRIFEACRLGVQAGQMCKYEDGGIRYGRIIKPDPAPGWLFGRRGT